MARGIRFCRTFLHGARVKKHFDMRESRAILAFVRFSHVRMLLDLRNVQKSVTQIIYLEPLPTRRSTLPASIAAAQSLAADRLTPMAPRPSFARRHSPPH